MVYWKLIKMVDTEAADFILLTKGEFEAIVNLINQKWEDEGDHYGSRFKMLSKSFKKVA